MWVIGLPLTWLLVKPHRPEYYGLLPDGATAEEVAVDTSQMIEKGVKYAAEVEEVEFTLRQALRTPTYWLIIAAMLGQTLIVGTIFIHGIPFLTDFGLDILIVAGIFAMMSFVGLPVRLGSAFLVDRIKREHLRFLLVGAFLLEAAGITAFLLHQTIAMIYVWFILHGLGTGITGSVVLPMRGRYFGRKAYGSIAGVSQFVVMIVGVATPIYAGWVYDTTGSYMTVFKLSVAALVVAIVLAFLISPPKLPAQITDTQKIV